LLMLFLLIRDLFSSFFSVISSYTGRFFFDVIFSSYSMLERRKLKILESNSTKLEWTFCKNCEYRFRCDWGNQPTCAPLMNSAGQASQYPGDSETFHFYGTSIRSNSIICWLQYLQIDLTYS